jgi:hypothetical protein
METRGRPEPYSYATSPRDCDVETKHGITSGVIHRRRLAENPGPGSLRDDAAVPWQWSEIARLGRLRWG